MEENRKENIKNTPNVQAGDDMQTPHQRRVRYKGKYPRKFEEKYKELQPEKYKETAEHIIQKGNTPAGTHRPICVEEILSFLDVKPGQIGVDATLGYGGHTQKILDCLNGEGHLYSLDVDPIESEKTKKRLRDQGYGENVWDVCLMNFANIAEIEKKAGKLDFVLADLGVSSMQIDDPKRGFSFREEGPLDLRLNPQAGVPASERLKEMDAEEIEGMLFENSDEPLAKELARAIMSAKRKKQPIETTSQLREIVEQVVLRTKPENPKEAVKKTCQRVFQALRIDVNSEFEVLDSFLEALPHILKPGGKAAILTFHSGEDRMVKKSFQYYAREGIYSDIAKDVIRPSAKECASNPRARSTKFRWAVRSDVQKSE